MEVSTSFIGFLFSLQRNYLVDWLVGSLVGWLVGSLVVWLAEDKMLQKC